MFKLDRSNKYSGSKIKDFKKFKINMVSKIMSGVFLGVCFLDFFVPKVRDLYIKNVVMDSSIVDYSYESMSNEDKSRYVVELFCDCIDCNDKISFKQKDMLKENISKFLSDWGYLYDRDGLVNMEAALSMVKFNVFDEYQEMTGFSASYIPFFNMVLSDDDVDEKSLLHEVGHVITIDLIGDEFDHFISEGINSSIDNYYYDCDSYFSLFRNQVFFLSEVVGRENLLRCYINGDVDSLRELVGDELLELFKEEYAFFRKNLYCDGAISDEISFKLKDMYEKKSGKKINEDAVIYAIYMCMVENDYSLDCTLFDDKVSFSYDYNKMVISRDDRGKVINDISDYIDILDSEFLDSYNRGVMKDTKDSYNDNCECDMFKNMILLFGNDVCMDIINSDDCYSSICGYLKDIGVKDKDLDATIYKLSNNYLSLFDCVQLYRDKFNYLYNNGRLDFAVSDIRELSDEWEDVLKILFKENNISDEEFDVYSGYNWIKRDYFNGYDSSIIRYNKLVNNRMGVYHNNGMSYSFYNDNGEVSYSDYEVNGEYVYYSFEEDGVYVYGNEDRLTCSELGIGINNSRSK